MVFKNAGDVFTVNVQHISPGLLVQDLQNSLGRCKSTMKIIAEIYTSLLKVLRELIYLKASDLVKKKFHSALHKGRVNFLLQHSLHYCDLTYSTPLLELREHATNCGTSLMIRFQHYVHSTDELSYTSTSFCLTAMMRLNGHSTEKMI